MTRGRWGGAETSRGNRCAPGPKRRIYRRRSDRSILTRPREGVGRKSAGESRQSGGRKRSILTSEQKTEDLVTLTPSSRALPICDFPLLTPCGQSCLLTNRRSAVSVGPTDASTPTHPRRSRLLAVGKQSSEKDGRKGPITARRSDGPIYFQLSPVTSPRPSLSAAKRGLERPP